MNNSILEKTISLMLVVSILLCSITCGTAFADNQRSSSNSPIDNIDIQDALVTLDIREIKTVPISTNEINVDEILVHCIGVTEIDTIEIEITSINDEFVYLAYKNFVSVYGDDFNLKDFLIDVGIGASCVIIYVTLSTVGGPVGTFFGAVIHSQLTVSAVVIGTAIDAAVSAYQAYEEGGDASYIIGHMLNGIADGFKWTAILAPLTGADDGIKALRAVSALRKVPGFEEITDKAARKVFQRLAVILKKTADVGDNYSDDVVRSLAKELGGEFSEDLLRSVLSNRSLLTSIVRKFNPYNVSSEVVQALQNSFLKKAGLTDDLGKEFLKDIKRGAIKRLDDISDPTVREFIENNMYEFAECFGASLSKGFIDDCLRTNIGDDTFSLIKKSITSDNLYFDLVESLGKESADWIVSDSNTLILLQLRYGSTNVNRLINARLLYDQLKRNNNIPDEQLKTVICGIFHGSIKSLDDVAAINAQLARNLCGSREIVSATIRGMGNEKSLSGLLDDVARVGFESLDFSSEFSADLIEHGLSKTDIIQKYGDDVYKQLLDSYNLSIGCLGVQAKVNSALIQDLTIDSLRANGLSDNAIIDILSGKRIAEWGLSDNQVMGIWNVVADYYRTSDTLTYKNFVMEIAEVRGEYISGFMEQYRAAGNTVRNSRYAGSIMQPTGSNAAFIKAKYGDVYMSKQGFVILDDFAVARVELTGLTGLNGGTDDIARANLAHHGTQSSIPGYTWHHLEDGRTMIMVPTELHEAYRHTGGADLLREGLLEAIEDGVY